MRRHPSPWLATWNGLRVSSTDRIRLRIRRALRALTVGNRLNVVTVCTILLVTLGAVLCVVIQKDQPDLRSAIIPGAEQRPCLDETPLPRDCKEGDQIVDVLAFPASHAAMSLRYDKAAGRGIGCHREDNGQRPQKRRCYAQLA
jgi:hypothetical protein